MKNVLNEIKKATQKNAVSEEVANFVTLRDVMFRRYQAYRDNYCVWCLERHLRSSSYNKNETDNLLHCYYVKTSLFNIKEITAVSILL